MSRYQFIEQDATTEPVQIFCRVLVSSASYYQWLSRMARLVLGWEHAASTAFSRHAQRYGTRRLRAKWHSVGRYALHTTQRQRHSAEV